MTASINTTAPAAAESQKKKPGRRPCGSPIDPLIFALVHDEPGIHLAVIRREILRTGLRATSSINSRVFKLAALGRLRLDRDPLDNIRVYPAEADA